MYDVATGHPIVQATLRVLQTHDPLWWILLLVAVFGTVTLTNAVLLRQYALATGHSVSTGSELATGARRVPGMLLIAMLLTLAITATFIPLLIVAWPLVGIGSSSKALLPGVIWMLVAVSVLLLISASWVAVRWICAGAVYLLTDRGPVASMSYSWQLTSGNFWRLSVIYAVGVVLIIVLYVLSSVIGGVIALLLAHGDVAVITATGAVVVTLLGAVVTPFYSALLLAVFGDVSVRREGADLAQRISAPATQ
ncbi:MAG TPA: glycerophosphoryl diester phosphodiesterase membrane domain-containing protein [Steroidobacteraceae bacterium]